MFRKSVAGTPADPTAHFATLEIDGQAYSLIYDFNAIAEAEALIPDCNLLHGIAAVYRNTWNARQLRGLFYAALQRAHPQISLTGAGSLIGIDTMPEIRDALLAAYAASLPEAKNPPAAGAESGPAPAAS